MASLFSKGKGEVSLRSPELNTHRAPCDGLVLCVVFDAAGADKALAIGAELADILQDLHWRLDLLAGFSNEGANRLAARTLALCGRACFKEWRLFERTEWRFRIHDEDGASVRTLVHLVQRSLGRPLHDLKLWVCLAIWLEQTLITVVLAAFDRHRLAVARDVERAPWGASPSLLCGLVFEVQQLRFIAPEHEVTRLPGSAVAELLAPIRDRWR